jgi:hypothetical protein
MLLSGRAALEGRQPSSSVPRVETVRGSIHKLPLWMMAGVNHRQDQLIEPFGCADKPAEKHCWMICYERKILFHLKKQAEKDGL